MRLPRSEVFEEYAKIAEEMGLYREEKGPSSPKPGVIDNPNNGADSWMRWDTSDLTDSELFYGVKPNKKDENATKNMMEQAHPESVVIAPAYDRINGLVENNIERQKILINIIGRPPTGNQNHRKLAHQEMLMELVRLGNQLDNSREDQLRALADSCIERLAQEHGEKEMSYMPMEFESQLTSEDDDYEPEHQLEGMDVPAPTESSFTSAVDVNGPSEDEIETAKDLLRNKMEESENLQMLEALDGSNIADIQSFITSFNFTEQEFSRIHEIEDLLDALVAKNPTTENVVNAAKHLLKLPVECVEMVMSERTPEMLEIPNLANSSDLNDVSPKGWGKTVEKMKKHQDISNPFGLAYWMKDQNYKPHPNKK